MFARIARWCVPDSALRTDAVAVRVAYWEDMTRRLGAA